MISIAQLEPLAQVANNSNKRTMVVLYHSLEMTEHDE